MDVNRNNQETEGPKDVVKKENNPLDLSLTKKEQEHNLEEEDENDSIEVNDDEVKNEVKNEVSLAQSPIFSYHSHTHSHSGYSSQPLGDFLPTYLAQAVELWE